MTAKRNFFALGLAFSVAFGLLFMVKQNAMAVAPKRNPLPSDYYTGTTWQEAHKCTKPIVVTFFVDWCGACKRFAPKFESYNKKYNSEYNFVMVKADDKRNQKIVNQFDVTGYPTVYLVDEKGDKKVKLKPAEFFNEDVFKNKIETFLE